MLRLRKDRGWSGEALLYSGRTVTPDRYRCRACGFDHEVPAETITNLPVCPRCQGQAWQARPPRRTAPRGR